MTSVVNSTFKALNQGVAVTDLPSTGFELTSVNLVATARISGIEQGILIEGVDLDAFNNITDRVADVSAITTENSRVPVAAFWPASVEPSDIVFRFTTPVDITLQSVNNFGVISTVTSVPSTIEFYTGNTTETTRFAEMAFNNSLIADVSVTSSTVVPAGNFILATAPTSVGQQLRDFSFTLWFRRS